MKLEVLILFSLLCSVFAAEDSCVGRCLLGFDSKKKCQCDSLCHYYDSCCPDYHSICRTKVGRGDVFEIPEDEFSYDLVTDDPTVEPFTDGTPPGLRETVVPDGSVLIPVKPDLNESTPQPGPEEATVSLHNPDVDIVPVKPEEEVPADNEEVCSGQPFDAFTDLKNGSIYAFRGKYFYELNETSVMPGYPKLIQDVWGIEGPIDSAFTRINCQGKTYILKGKEYWRFDDGVLEQGFPRFISDGFSGIPSDIDAAFALPASNFHGNERVYFFKGRQYWYYDFKNQPSHQDCETTSRSQVFDRYALLQGDSFEDLFGLLFGSHRSALSTNGPRYISTDWKGVPSGVDAAMAGRIYLTPSTSNSKKKYQMKRKSRRGRKERRRKGHQVNLHMSSWDSGWDLFDWDLSFDGSDDSDYDMDWKAPLVSKCTPIQSVYFFVKDEYYRVNLKTKRVDYVRPRYPRSIATYWLGCKDKAERKK